MNLLAEATAEPEWFDRDYIDNNYIDPDSLWEPVVDRQEMVTQLNFWKIIG